MDHTRGERIVVNQENKKERGVNVWNTLKLQKKIWKQSIFAVPFLTIKIFRYALKKVGLQSDLRKDWFPFLADPKFLNYKGFMVCDESDNGIQLWYLPFREEASIPEFKECALHPHIDEPGYVLYYTNQCPFNAKYVPVLEKIAKERAIPFQTIHIQNKEDARNAPTPITTYALFFNGNYLTNEQMNEKRFLKLVE